VRSSPVRHLAEAGICHQFLWTVSQPIQFCDNGTVRRGANSETASEPSQVQGQFRALHRCSYPEGYGCYCTTRRSDPFGRATSLHKARLPQAAGRAKGGTRRGAARDGNTRQPSEIGAVPQTGITQLQVESSLRGKRSDPSHGANAPPQAVAVPVVKVPERMYSCRRPSTRPASEPPAGGHRTGRRGLTR
jgi:hypothetical protein